MIIRLPIAVLYQNKIESVKTGFTPPKDIPLNFGRFSALSTCQLNGQIDRDIEISIFHGSSLRASARDFTPL